MFNALKRLGIHGWRDMSQENITTQGMMQGVRDSDVFVLLLTTSTLSRWYCLLEIACALECGKPIVVVVEENPEFSAWDIERWRNDQCTRAADNQDRAQRSWHVSINLQTPYAKLEALRFEEQGLRQRLHPPRPSSAYQLDAGFGVSATPVTLASPADRAPHSARAPSTYA